ncbi:MAG: hypothetical protein UFA98_10160 [Ruminococcus sp.]|nr:hypothetical protein [Ruminococcus sp.]
MKMFNIQLYADAALPQMTPGDVPDLELLLLFLVAGVICISAIAVTIALLIFNRKKKNRDLCSGKDAENINNISKDKQGE